MANLIQVRDEVEEKCGRHNTEFTDLIDGFINDTCQDVTEDMNFWFMKTTHSYDLTLDGGGQYELSELTKEIDEIYLQLDESFRKLDRVPLHDALVRFGPTPDVGEPWSVVVENQTITLYPPPKQDYTLRVVVYSRFSDLVENEDTNFLLTFRKKLVVFGALAKAYGFLQEYEDAQYWQAKFDKQLILLRREHNSRTLDGELTLVPKTGVGDTLVSERGGGWSGVRGYY